MIAHLKLQVAKLRREQFGSSAERTRRLFDLMELQPEDLEVDAADAILDRLVHNAHRLELEGEAMHRPAAPTPA